MRFLRATAAETGKILTLPGVWAGIIASVLGTIAITAMNAVQAASALDEGEADLFGPISVFETAFAAAPLGTIGAIVVGVLAVSSEYAPNSPDAGGSRQITSTLIAIPGRIRIVLAKTTAVVAITILTAFVAFPSCLAVAQLLLGDRAPESVDGEQALWRLAGATIYWTLTALLALGITLITRSAALPLIILILNSSVVSISLLLTKVTSLAHWLPDMAGRNLFGFDAELVLPGGLDAVPGGLIMAAWAAASVVAGAIVFARRDA